MAELVLDLVIENSQAARSVQEMRSSLKELESAIANVPEGSKEWSKIGNAAAQLKDRMADAREQIDAMAGESLERLQGGLSNTQSKLTQLDFGGAAAQIQIMSNTIKGLSLKEMSEGLGGVTKSIVAMGKAIATNPLFLIGGVIIAIVSALWKLREAGGFVTEMFDGIKKILDVVIGGFKKLTDAIGLTNFAMQEATKKSNEELEKQKQLVIDLQNENKTLQGIVNAGAAAEKTNLEKLNDELKLRNEELVEAENLYKGIQKFIDPMTDEEKKKNAELIKQNNEYVKTIKLTKERIGQIEKLIVKEQDLVEAQKKSDDLQAKRKVILSQIAIAEGAIADNLTDQLILQNKTKLAFDDWEKGLITTNEYNDKIVRLGESSKKLINNLTPIQEGLLKLQTELLNLNATSAEKTKNNAELRLKLLELQSKTQEDLNKKTEKLTELTNKELINYQEQLKFFSEREQSLELYNQLEAENINLQEQSLNNLLVLGKEQEYINAVREQSQKINTDLNNEEITALAHIKDLKDREIISEFEYADMKSNIDANYQAKRLQNELDTNAKIAAARQQVLAKIDAYMQQAFTFESQLRDNKASAIEREMVLELNALNSKQMGEEEYEQAVKEIKEKAWLEEEKLRKRTFYAEKAQRMAGAIMQGAQSVVAALTVPPPVGQIMAGINGAIATAQVAAIAAQKYVPSLESNNPNFKPNISTSIGAGSSIEPNQNITMFQTQSQGTQADVTPFDPNKDIVQRVIVYESDVTKSQSRNRRARETAVI